MKMFTKKKLATLCTVVAVVSALSVGAFADEATNTAMTTALTTVKTDSVSALAVVAPIGIGIMGAFLVWRFGIRFFKGLAK